MEFWASKKLGLSTVDIFTVDISTLEPTQYNKFLINIQILESKQITLHMKLLMSFEGQMDKRSISSYFKRSLCFMQKDAHFANSS